MPNFRLETNISESKIPANFLKETTALMAKTLGKPESYCVATVVPNVSMVWGGNPSTPCATATLMSIGRLGVEENKKHSAVFAAHVEKNLGIASDKMYINFVDAPSSDVGYNGTTFHEILGS